jgi:hypothetical protein
MKPLATWESIDLRVDGTRANEIARQQLVPKLADDVQLVFTPGLLRVRVKKFLWLTVEIERIDAQGTVVRVPIARAGLIPTRVLAGVWHLVRGFIAPRIPIDAVTLQAPLTFVIQVDRFLPPFVRAEVREIRIVDGGLAVALGPGGADLPPKSGGS